MRYFTTVALLSFTTSVAGYWCPGAIEGHGGGTIDNYCCVGGQLTISRCKGWPICHGSATIKPRAAEATPDCSASIPVTASDYDDLVSSASSKYLKSGSGAPATATSTSDDATSTDSGSQNDEGSTNGAAMNFATMLAPVGAGMMAYAVAMG
ncbi:hypothetical protein NW762_012404 [Fusarium torreyae]|uniref:Uncharacterized protein n=1 Tax=Fusarium torreyae TaxID=1237075 RepID=A0A9W8RR50_9HYPO|nr:hypothetical protein NW762_012404 [Fusarium torreyae]